VTDPLAPERLGDGWRRWWAAAAEPIDFAASSRADRAVLCVVGGLLGLVAGVLGTVQHLAVIVIAGVPVRYGIVLAAAVCLALLLALRGVVRGRLPVVLCAVALGGSIVAAQVPSWAGTLLVGGQALSQLWGIGMPFLALLVAAWPDFSALQRRG
jgi:hypothetical protein